MTPDNLSAKDVGMTTKRDEQMAEKYATILVPLYESGICVEQYTEIDEELKRAYLAGLKAGRVKLSEDVEYQELSEMDLFVKGQARNFTEYYQARPIMFWRKQAFLFHRRAEFLDSEYQRQQVEINELRAKLDRLTAQESEDV